MTIVLDAGALIALERGDRELHAILANEARHQRRPVTHGGVIGQVWRGTARQARLARALRGVRVAPLDEDLGRRAGVLLRLAVASDVLDAAVVLLAVDGDAIFTSDVEDLRQLAEASGIHLELIGV